VAHGVPRASSASWHDLRRSGGTAKPTGERGTLLDVRIDDYRYLTPAARFGFGIMTGNAYIVARIRFLNLANSELFGEQRYSTTSTAWEGVFSAMTGKQVEGIAAQVVRAIITKSDQRGAPTLAAPAAEAASTSLVPVSTTRLTGSGIPARNTLPPSAPPIGEDTFAAERLAEAKQCNPAPRAVLSAKGAGFEAYTMACTDGNALSIRCEFGNCRVLR